MYLTAPDRAIVTVPDLRKLELAAARRAADDAGLEVEVGDSLPNPNVPAGAVLVQSPLPGGEVAPGSSVRLILSTGPERRAIPSVGVLSEEQAAGTLRAMGFQVTVQRVSSPRREGRVVGTIPAAGSRVPVPSAVRLLVSAGPPKVVTPRLVGLPQEQAAALLETAGLELGEPEREYHPELEAGIVLAQRPAAGDTVPQGSGVHVVVSSHDIPGPAPVLIH
jgi:serine/threonine-protein kinase